MTPVSQPPRLDSFSETRKLESFGQPNPVGYLDQQVPLAPAIQHMAVNNISQPMHTAPGIQRDPLTDPEEETRRESNTCDQSTLWLWFVKFQINKSRMCGVEQI